MSKPAAKSRVCLNSFAVEWRKEEVMRTVNKLDPVSGNTYDAEELAGHEMRPYDRNGLLYDWSVQAGSQHWFINCPVFEVLYTGNRGGGKTECLLMDFIKDCGKGYGANWQGILFRHTYKELRDVVKKLLVLYPKVAPGAKWNDTKMVLTFPDGEQLTLAYMEHESDYYAYHGHAYPWIAWEELTTWPDSGCYTRMISCCRSTKTGMPRRIRSTTNPYGPGFTWVKERFRLPIPPGQMLGDVIETTGEDAVGARCVINSDLRENLVLLTAQPDYLNNIRASARNPAELSAWLHGSWDITSGGMFDDIWVRVRDICVVPPFRIPESWRIDTSFDWGSSKPFSVAWWAESDGSPIRMPNGVWRPTLRGDLYRIKEWYGWDGKHPNRGCRMLAKDISKGMIEREKKWGIWGRVRRGIADAAIFDDTNGNSIARDMEETVVIDGERFRGIFFDPADKRSGSRKQGWEQVRKMLSAVLPAEGQPIREEPGLFVTTECVHFLRTVPTIPRDPDDLDDVDTEAEDHVADEVRYRCRKEHRIVKEGRTTGMG